MLPPQKPWETGTINQRSLPSFSHSDGLQSSSTNFGSYATPIQSRTFRNPPPLPPRPSHPYQRLGASYNTPNYYSSPYSSYGGYSSINSYGTFGYGSGINGFNGYGGYGNHLGFHSSIPESRYIQIAEEGARPAFQSIESLVHAFGSVNFMLESTFNAMYSSFRAVLGMAENFGRLRALFGQFFSVFTIFKWLQWLYRKCLYLLGLRSNDPGREELWRQASAGVMGNIGVDVTSETQKTSWPLMMFMGIILSGPYLMWKLLSSVEVPNFEPYNVKDWKKCKEPCYSAIALYDFVGASSEDVSLRTGQKILIAPRECQQSRNWLLATTDGKKVGLVPANYIKIMGRTILQPETGIDHECNRESSPSDSNNEADSGISENIISKQFLKENPGVTLPTGTSNTSENSA